MTRPALLVAWLQTKPGVCHRIERAGAPSVTSQSKPNTALPASELVDPLPKYLSIYQNFLQNFLSFLETDQGFHLPLISPSTR